MRRRAALKNAEVEKGRLFAERSRTELGDKLSAATTTATALSAQWEAARPLFEQAVNLHGAAQEAAKQTEQEKTKASEILKSLDASSTAVKELVSQIDAVKTIAENARAEIATKSQYIEDGERTLKKFVARSMAAY